MQTFLTWGLFCFMLLFFSEKNQTVGYIYNASSLYSQTGENTKRAETFVWCLLFKVVYQDHATQLLPFAWDFVEKGQRLVFKRVKPVLHYYIMTLKKLK